MTAEPSPFAISRSPSAQAAGINLTYLFISHDLRVVAALASRLMVMRQGKAVESGDDAELFKNPRTDYTRALLAAAFNLETAHTGVVAQ